MVSDITSMTVSHYVEESFSGYEALVGVHGTEDNLRAALILEQARREEQRMRMVAYRAKKKKRVAQMARERLQLEAKLTSLVSTVRKEADHLIDYSHGSEMIATRDIPKACARLTRENMALRQMLDARNERKRTIQTELNILKEKLADSSAPQSRFDAGWRVHFSNGEPSFYFHPFTRTEFDSAMTSYDNSLRMNPSSIPATGKLFGWTVHHSPLYHREDHKAIARTRFTTRVHCSLDDVDVMVSSTSMDVWPMLTTPTNWKHDQRGSVTNIVLQTFEWHELVMVCSIPGDNHLRFFQLARRQVMLDEASGNRAVQFSVVAADSKANTRNRAAEESASNIEWIHEGGHSIKFTEVDQGTVDIEYNHWAICESELHAQHLYIRWAHYVTTCFWSQRILTPKLIRST